MSDTYPKPTVLRVYPQPPTPNYWHRDGSTELPTVVGIYWFDGAMDEVKARGLAKVDVPNRTSPTLTIWPYWIDGWAPSEWFAGRWWGPLVAPWEFEK